MTKLNANSRAFRADSPDCPGRTSRWSTSALPSPRTWNAWWKAAVWLVGLAVAGHFLWVTAQRYVQVTPEVYGMLWTSLLLSWAPPLLA